MSSPVRVSAQPALLWGGAVVVLLSLASLAERVPLGPALVPPLEERFSRADLRPGDEVDGIIALGGSLERTVVAVELAKRYPRAKLIVTGTGEAAAHAYVRRHGMAERLVVEGHSRTTYENAKFSAKALHPRPGQRWVVVTDAWHMPRAVGAFRAAGFSVLPWPIVSAPDSARFTGAIARHEWLGLVAYRLLGRSSSLFPAEETRRG